MRKIATIAIAFVAASFVLAACPLDPAKVPPCTGREVYPDPCAAASRDAGRE